MDKLEELRKIIDETDDTILALLERRMEISLKIGDIKKENGLPVFDAKREEEVVCKLQEKASEKTKDLLPALYASIFESSRGLQAVRAGLLGRKLPYTFSVELHEKFGTDYAVFEKEEKDLADFFRNLPVPMLNVTAPYKTAVIPFLDEWDEGAALCGAVNTVLVKNGKKRGFNTDMCGIVRTFERFFVNLQGKHVVVLGSGGASRAVQKVCADRGALLTVITRTGKWNYENYGVLTDTDILINATPVGTEGVGGCLVDLTKFPRLSFVFDLVYNPLKTDLILQAEERNVPCADGLFMLVCQAAASESIWRGNDGLLDRVESVYRETLKEKQNIVLIGMPSSGKTTIGRKISEKTGRKFYDVDEEIEKEEGTSVQDIFSEKGEPYFRHMEQKVAERLGKLHGAVIATGGGTPMDELSRKNLKRNGVICYVMRDLSGLSSVGRPVLKKVGAEALLSERAPVYRAFSDFSVQNEDAERAAEEIIRIYEENYCH